MSVLPNLIYRFNVQLCSESFITLIIHMHTPTSIYSQLLWILTQFFLSFLLWKHCGQILNGAMSLGTDPRPWTCRGSILATSKIVSHLPTAWLLPACALMSCYLQLKSTENLPTCEELTLWLPSCSPRMDLCRFTEGKPIFQNVHQWQRLSRNDDTCL